MALEAQLVARVVHQRDAALDTRERLLGTLGSAPGRVVLSTCHRVEVYEAVDQVESSSDMRTLVGREAAAHLFRVAGFEITLLETGEFRDEPHPEHDLSRTSETIRVAADQDLSAMGIEVRSLFIRIRDADSMQRKEVGGVDKMNRELHQMDLRVRRIEEKMGFSVSGHPP